MYDPEDDETLRCQCDGKTPEYEDGWNAFFEDELVPEQVATNAAEILRFECPRVIVRHAVARLAVSMAYLMIGGGDTRASNDIENLADEIPVMLREMAGDAVEVLRRRGPGTDSPSRGAVAGWKKKMN